MMKYVFLTFILASTQVFTKEIHYLARSPRALLMGDAYTAIAADEYSLFYNPAVLARDTGLRLYPFNLTISTINPTKGLLNPIGELDRFTNFPSDPAGIVNRIMGFPVYVHMGGAPAIKFGPFGFSVFVASTTSVVLANSAHPAMTVDQRLDQGFIFGYAHSFALGGEGGGGGNSWANFKKKEPTGGGKLSLGGSIKQMTRTSVKGSHDLYSTGMLADLNNLTLGTGALKSLFGYGKGSAWGFDLGVDYTYGFGNSTLAAGLSLTDVFDTRFTKTEGSQGILRQEMISSMGVAWKQDYFFFDYSVSVDFRPILQSVSFGRKLHFGLEVGVPGFHFLGGLNEGYLSYGIRTTIWPFTLMAGFYGVELGTSYRQLQGKRFILYLSLLDFSFDG